MQRKTSLQPKTRNLLVGAPSARLRQLVEKVLQAKMRGVPSAISQSRSAPAAPPVYRPQHRTPGAMQPKTANNQKITAGNTRHNPAPPPVYRPQPKKVVQPKISLLETRKPAAAPPVYRPALSPTVQRLKQQRPDNVKSRALNLTRVATPIAQVAPREKQTNASAQIARQSQSVPKPPRLQMRTQNSSPASRPAVVSGRQVPEVNKPSIQRKSLSNRQAVIQRKVGFEYEVRGIETEKNSAWFKCWPGAWRPHQKGAVIVSKTGYDITADINGAGGSNIEFVTKPIDETNDGEVRQLRLAARNITADLQAIHNASKQSDDGWVGADELRRINGWWWHRFQSAANRWDALFGQLQMTGGVRLTRLDRVVSGSALGQEPTRQQALLVSAEAEQERAVMTRYYQANPAGEARQPIFQAALAAMVGKFVGWSTTGKRMVASVIAIMAQIPIEKRMGGEYTITGPGLLLAKTDYSKILYLIASGYQREIPDDDFVDALIETINAIVPGDAAVNAGSPVLPGDYQVGNMTFTQLTIGSWARNALPDVDFDEEDDDDQIIQGRDRLTSAHFPGNAQQKKEMRAFGTFGSKTDSGGKVIFEWRSLASNHPDDLETAISNLVDYLGRRVNG